MTKSHQPSRVLLCGWCCCQGRLYSGKSLSRKLRETAEACCQEGLGFPPLAGAVTQVKQIAAALPRKNGQEESVVTSQLFGRFSLNLMRGNALMLSSRLQADCPPHVDGIM